MKKLKLLRLAVTSLICFLGINKTATAQKMMFDSKTCYSILDERTVTYKCSVGEISSIADANTLASKLTSYKGILKAEASNFSGGKADLLITVVKNESLFVCKNAVIGAGISTVYIDGKPVNSEEIMNVAKGMQAQK